MCACVCTHTCMCINECVCVLVSPVVYLLVLPQEDLSALTHIVPELCTSVPVLVK